MAASRRCVWFYEQCFRFALVSLAVDHLRHPNGFLHMPPAHRYEIMHRQLGVALPCLPAGSRTTPPCAENTPVILSQTMVPIIATDRRATSFVDPWAS